MPFGPILIKILVVATLLLGSAALLTNIMPSGRQALRSRKLIRQSLNPGDGSQGPERY